MRLCQVWQFAECSSRGFPPNLSRNNSNLEMAALCASDHVMEIVAGSMLP
jgi:hypothetical protein